MGILDNLLGKAANAAAQAAVNAAGTTANSLTHSAASAAEKAAKAVIHAAGTAAKTKEIKFPSVPSGIEAFKVLPQAALETPFDTAALTVLALSFYPENQALSLAALDYLRGPNPLSGIDRQFIADRFIDKKDYVPRSYFNGATPQNNYTPSQPWTVRVTAGPYAYQNEGYAKLELHSGGADSPREVLLRKAKTGKWHLWEQYLLPDIRPPESENPWA